jgi:beta-lactamase class A
MKTTVVAVISMVALVLLMVVVARLFKDGPGAETARDRAGAASRGPTVAVNASQAQQSESVDAELAARLGALCERAGGVVGVALIHVETGRTAMVQGVAPLPLYSVFKLPLAVSVLKDVEENRLRLDQSVSIRPEEAAPGWKGNGDLWRKPVERTIRELLALSIERSDNTSSDKLLELVGGPSAVTQRMRALGFEKIDIHASTREFAAHRDNPNTGTAEDLAHLLARLERGEVLQPPQQGLLLGLMERAKTGEKRLRGDLPAGTVVADKTGTGEPGSSTNDVGIITLPQGKGHLAMAVLVSGSKLPDEAQEKLIAELARAAYDAHVSGTAPGTQ